MRRPVNKYQSSRSFRQQTRKVASLNVARPGRGGFRL